MSNICATQLQALACSAAPDAFVKWTDPLNAAMVEFQINTRQRVQMFLAQVFHESANLSALEENLNYGAPGLIATWPSRFDEGNVNAYARQPQKIANKVYASRLGNGDEASGDGWSYRGRGLIQLTGKANYIAAMMALDIDCLVHPELLAEPPAAARTAAWFWSSRRLNEAADAGDFNATTRAINGGDIGSASRQALWARAKQVILY